ncbi:hypothetical protein JM18_006826 [Phytophthora kernoviae]|uniref:EF-hand domain-containing protein n=2 Tax=Phytophthora kernoviae TaxID=325452 RepID=A0A8T0LSP8_9STRA|nr:hypothetical protein G195_006272 [Phytophthora kernoviae 00238/432]KAG2519999.1 hypothetical protein JM16_006917 [Phytophthora kernoviae]KAG2520969.1 hypothetical protein JM18_006826 [Phytophthora kernoviae]
MELVAMQDMDSDLLNLDVFFGAHDDDEVVDLWNLTTTYGHDDDLLDEIDLEPLSPPIKEEPQDAVQVKQVANNKFGLTVDTSTTATNSNQMDIKTVNTLTVTLPARFALLSTTCVYEPGFTTSPRGKRRISQTISQTPVPEFGPGKENGDEEDSADEQEEEGGDEESGANEQELFELPGDEDYYMPEFTDAEFAAMIESPSKLSTTSTASPVPSPLFSINEAMPYEHESHLAPEASNTSTADSGTDVGGQTTPDMINMFNSIYDSSQNFLAAQQQTIDLTGGSPVAPTLNLLAPSSQAVFPMASLFQFNQNVATANPAALPFDYFSPSGYAAAANQFLGYQQSVQPFFLNPDVLTPEQKAALVQGQLDQAQANANAQIAAAMAMANSAAAMNMQQMKTTYGVPIAPLQRRSMPPNISIKAAAPIKPRVPVARSASSNSASPTTNANGKVNRLAITPDIADFKLVQIFHQFCDPVTKVLTLSRFQQLLLHHQVKQESSGASSSPSNVKQRNSEASSPANANAVVTPDAQSLFKILDINNIGALDLERFMHSFQICNRCTEAKRRAHQALCASQGQTFMPSALERQLMEDVAPVVVRVVPTSFEGQKVKSCEHYQWTWCEGFEKTGNEKCRGTNRHDKCPKYLANCTLWKHKLPPKSRKPKRSVEDLLDGSLEDKLLGKLEDHDEVTTTEDDAWNQRRQQLRDESELSMDAEDEESDIVEGVRESDKDHAAAIWNLSDRNTVIAVQKEAEDAVEDEEDEAFGSAKEEDNDDDDEDAGDQALEGEFSTDRLTRLSTRSTEDSYASYNEYDRDNSSKVFRDTQLEATNDTFMTSSAPASLRETNFMDDDDEMQQQEQKQEKEHEEEHEKNDAEERRSSASSSSSHQHQRSSKKKSRGRKHRK